MNTKATVLKECDIYEYPSIDSKKIGTFNQGEFINWTRERYKKREIWLEVVLSPTKNGYIFSKDTFKWEKCQLRNTSLKMIIEESEKEIRIRKGDVLYKIYPEEKSNEDKTKSNIMILADEKLNIGKVKYASLKSNFDINSLLVIVGAICASLICVFLVYWSIVVMILGGRIFFGGLVIAALLFVWKFAFYLMMILLKSIQSFFYKLKISF